MTATTLADVVANTGKAVLDYLDLSTIVPVVDQVGAQGDVSVLRVTTKPATAPMPKTVTVVESEASSNTHTLHPDGPCFWEAHRPSGVGDVTLGTLTVPEDSQAYLSHQEHGAVIIAPGTYRIGRQRELRGEWAMVAD